MHAIHIHSDRMFTSGWGSSSARKAKRRSTNISELSAPVPVLLGAIEDGSSSVTNGDGMHSSWTSEDGNYLTAPVEIGRERGKRGQSGRYSRL